jgi:hypothetical protein
MRLLSTDTTAGYTERISSAYALTNRQQKTVPHIDQDPGIVTQEILEDHSAHIRAAERQSLLPPADRPIIAYHTSRLGEDVRVFLPHVPWWQRDRRTSELERGHGNPALHGMYSTLGGKGGEGTGGVAFQGPGSCARVGG